MKISSDFFWKEMGSMLLDSRSLMGMFVPKREATAGGGGLIELRSMKIHVLL
jgi:hypothetical protein